MTSLADLPEDVMLRILELCAIEDALILTQACKAIHSLSSTRGFWLSILSSLRRRRPVPVDHRTADTAALRSAVLESLRVHHKLSVLHDTSFIRHTAFPSVMEDDQGGRAHRSPWVILLKDGKRMLQIIRQVIYVRDIKTTQLLAQVPVNGDVQSLGHQLTDQGIFLTLCLWHPWSKDDSSVEIWHLDRELCVIRQPLDCVPLDIVIYGCSSYYTVERELDDAILLYISDWEALSTSVYNISAALPQEALHSAMVAVTPTKLLLHLSLQTETRLTSFSHLSLPSHTHSASSTPFPCLHCPTLKPEWTLRNPFGPKPLWTIMNTAWDGRIGVTISAVPSSHASRMSQKVLLCQFDAEAQGEKLDLEDGLVSRHTEIMEGPDGRHVLNPGRYGKTVAWCYQGSRSDVDLPEFFFADRTGMDPDDPGETEGVFSKYAICDNGYTYRFNPPAWVAKHGRMLDMDFDDGRGRLALVMEDDTTVLFEF